jgi:outer membrane lipoprotein-sorting protein
VKHLMTLTALMLAAALPLTAAAGDLTADEILDRISETMEPEQAHGKVRMTITTSTGEERTFLYETFSKGRGDKALIKYLEPSRVKGQSILMLNDGNDIWTWFPRTKRVRKLATHAKKQKLEGSDFSYEDMGGGDEFREEFDAARLKDERVHGRPCYKLELVRREASDASYSRILLWVEQEQLVPLTIHYYHNRDPELWEKELVCSDVRVVDSIPTPFRYSMHNRLEGTSTSMETVEMHYDVDLPDDLFTEMGMQR